MAELLMGQETEYAMVAVSKDGDPVPAAAAAERLLYLARSSHPHLPTCQPSGMFLQNSTMIYVDSGDHVELALPEVTDPWEAARYQQAGDMILSRLLERLPETDDLIGEARLFKTNVDYAPCSGSSWGCHESYLHRRPAPEFRSQLMPHLISRLIYTGAGGWDSLYNGLEFMLSPRVAHLYCNSSRDSMRRRPIIHTKNEAHCKRGWHRLHLLCGESVCSETSAVLKLGTTALVVALLDAGISPLKGAALARPRSSMKQFSLDTECRRQTRMKGGEQMTALQIQRLYLNAVEDHCSQPFMPPWTDRICRLWRTTLDRLELQGAEGLAGTLDWAIKLALFRSRAARRGIPWEQIPDWNHIVSRIHVGLSDANHRDGPFTAETLIGPHSPIPRLMESMKPRMKRRGMAWDQLRTFIDLRQELFEMDLRFGELGQGSLFTLLEQHGALDHHLDGVDHIDQAVQHPPARGRAAIRGRVIRELAGTAGAFCYWSMVTKNFGREALDLTEPFCGVERWKTTSDIAVGKDEREMHIALHRRCLEQRDLLGAMDQIPRQAEAPLDSEGLPSALVI